MSVILTACRHSKQKALERAIKKKAEKKREKREAAMAAMTDSLGTDGLEGDASIKMWTFLLNGTPTSVVLHRDTLEVACNGDVIESTSDFCECGATIDFLIGTRSAQITSSAGERGIHFSLSIEGCAVPDSSAAPSDSASAMMGPSTGYEGKSPRPTSRARTMDGAF